MIKQDNVKISKVERRNPEGGAYDQYGRPTGLVVVKAGFSARFVESRRVIRSIDNDELRVDGELDVDPRFDIRPGDTVTFSLTTGTLADKYNVIDAVPQRDFGGKVRHRTLMMVRTQD